MRRKWTKMKYSRDLEQKKYNDLMDNCHVFWAFSNEQFEEGAKKNPLKSGDKYVSIGQGGYMPKSLNEKLSKGMKKIHDWARDSKKDDKAVILYELHNYESFYTGDIKDAVDRLKDLGYTKEQVQKVFKSNLSKERIA